MKEKGVDVRGSFFIAAIILFVTLIGFIAFDFNLSSDEIIASEGIEGESSNVLYSPPNAKGYVEGELIIKFKNDVGNNKITGIKSLDKLGTKYNVREIKEFYNTKNYKKESLRNNVNNFQKTKLLKLNTNTLSALEEYKKDPNVEFAQLNYIYSPDLIPNDPDYPDQEDSLPVVKMPEAWSIETGSSNVVIAILDDGGADLDHPDLINKIWTNLNEIPNNGFDDDDNGFDDDVYGWDFVSNDNVPDATGNDHGTHSAGIAGAQTNNNLGVAGACWGCKLMIIRMPFTTQGVTNAINYAIDNGARIISMSFGNYVINKYGPDTTVEQAINFGYINGINSVASAGNDEISTMRYPGALINVIGVGATGHVNDRAGFSNYGSWVDVSAPGLFVWSTKSGGTYGYISGTSMSTPLVSGIIGLLVSKHPEFDAETTKKIIEYTGDKINTDHYIGPRINALNVINSNLVPKTFAIIKSPMVIDPITNPLNIYGTIIGDSYILEYKFEQSSDWVQIGSGGQTIDGILGTLDTSSLNLAGFYNVRLSAFSDAESNIHQIKFYIPYPNCGGFSYNGYCWYEAGTDVPCSTACASVGKSCVQASWDDTGCAVCRHFEGSTATCAFQAATYIPFHITSSNTCLYAGTGNQNCNSHSGGGKRMCACAGNFCGDGTVNQPNEQCDDGNLNNQDGCTNLCSPPFCGDTFTTSGETCDDGNTIAGDGCDQSCNIEPYTRVFLTSQIFDGNLGGVMGADAKCQAAANTAGLGGIWKVWISDNLGNMPSSRFHHSTDTYRLLNGNIVANNWIDLTDGSLDNSINLDEFGNIFSSTGQVWTGTKIDGSYVVDKNCLNWESNSASQLGEVGYFNYMDNKWTYWGLKGCSPSSGGRLYCFEQPSYGGGGHSPGGGGTPINVPGGPTPDKKLPSTSVLPNGGLQDATA